LISQIRAWLCVANLEIYLYNETLLVIK